MLDNMQLIDTHTHTVYSGHGEGTPQDLVKVALDKGLSTLAITEHLPLPTQLDPDGTFSMLPAQVDEYTSEIDTARELVHHIDATPAANLEIICGVEVDWRQSAEEFILNQLGLDNRGLGKSSTTSSGTTSAKPRYQLILGSVHMLTGENPLDPLDYWPLDYIGTIDGWYQRGVRYVWEQYVRLWLDAVTSRVPFDIMSHPDLPKKLGFHPDFDASSLWMQMADAAAAKGVMIEVNTSGLFYASKEVFPCPQLLEEFCRAGVPCTISSDAHSPANVNRAYAEGIKAMLDAGYQKVTIPTADGDRREIPLV
ncbi:MAG: histidinol-phosphatase HisJ family protein [Coriobacteriales bacterium]|jgi:histidinol-phosphatase (PHP family)|nr:histidinol-phosphatase HisJ family protein [Coriobacteriales bacterium]